MVQSKTRPIYLLSPSKRDEAIHLPMISFSIATKEIDFSLCDTLMFSSKQAVKSADSINKRWKKYPCIAIGETTKKQIEELGGKVIYHPKDFYAKTLAKDVVRSFSDRNILYLRPKEVSFDSKGFLLRHGISLQEQIIYETSCIEYASENAPAENAIIIFTSPSSIRCFLKNFSWHSSYTAVVIGEATREYLPENADYLLADRPLISSCISKAKFFQGTSNTNSY